MLRKPRSKKGDIVAYRHSKMRDKLRRALKASIDENKFELLTSTTSLTFKSCKEKRIAVDHRANEVMVMRKV